MPSPKRVLPLKSIWDEVVVEEVLTKPQHRAKLWHWLIWDESRPKERSNNAVGEQGIPFDSWCISKESVARLTGSEFVMFTSKVVERKDSARGDTTKLLIELQDGHQIETVIMKHRQHVTVCVSSQIGCQMGCRFCATGTMGIIGDLTSGEIVEQLLLANDVAPIRNVVFMGMGEPLNNFENVKRAVLFMVDTKRFGLSPRHVTVSTVGVLKNMTRLTKELPLVNLALSLHAPNQQVRLKIVPAAAMHHIDKLMSAVDFHIQEVLRGATSSSGSGGRKGKKGAGEGVEVQASFGVDGDDDEADDADDAEGEEILTNITHTNTHKKRFHQSGVMLEYILIKDINDRPEHAHELGALLVSRRDFVLLNLIPYNPTTVAEDYEPPSSQDVTTFFTILTSEPYKVHTRVRQEKGQDIDGACGQLALKNGGGGGGGGGGKKGFLTDIEDSMSSSSSSSKRQGTSARASNTEVNKDSNSSNNNSSSNWWTWKGQHVGFLRSWLAPTSGILLIAAVTSISFSFMRRK